MLAFQKKCAQREGKYKFQELIVSAERDGTGTSRNSNFVGINKLIEYMDKSNRGNPGMTKSSGFSFVKITQTNGADLSFLVKVPKR